MPTMAMTMMLRFLLILMLLLVCYDQQTSIRQPAMWNAKTQKSFSLKLCKNRASFRASFNWVSKVIRNGFSFAFPRRVTGPDNSRHFFQPIRFKTKTNREIVTRVFPRFG